MNQTLIGIMGDESLRLEAELAHGNIDYLANAN
jgi:hypothetical protein